MDSDHENSLEYALGPVPHEQRDISDPIIERTPAAEEAPPGTIGEDWDD